MKKAEVIYLLNEEGRKKDLLSGGNGNMVQVIKTEATKELLDKAYVDEEGNIKVFFGVKKFSLDKKPMDLSNFWHGIPVDLKVEEPTIKKVYKKIEYKASNGKVYETEYAHEQMEERIIKEGSIKIVEEVVKFDKPMTVEELMDWDRKRVEKIEEKEKSLKAELDRMHKEKEEEIKKLKPELDEINEEKKQNFINKIEEEIEKKRKAKEEKEKLEREKVEWIGKYGSERLKKSQKLGYENQRLYVLERAEMEFPDYIVDFNETASFKDRVNPSLEALREVEELIDKGYDAEIVWLISKPTDHIGDEEDYYNRFEPREAIIIWNYLGKYSLYKF